MFDKGLPPLEAVAARELARMGIVHVPGRFSRRPEETRTEIGAFFDLLLDGRESPAMHPADLWTAARLLEVLK